MLSLALLLAPAVGLARETLHADGPAFTAVPEFSAGSDLLFKQDFQEARETGIPFRSGRNPFVSTPLLIELFKEIARRHGYCYKGFSGLRGSHHMKQTGL